MGSTAAESCFPMEPGDWYALAKFDLTLRLQQSEHGTHSSRLQGERSQGTKIFVQLRPHTIINSDSKAHDGKPGASNKKNGLVRVWSTCLHPNHSSLDPLGDIRR